MCGRYFFAENIDISKYVKILEKNYDQLSFDLLTIGEVKPSNVALTFVQEGPDLAKWGYHFNNRLLINARSESLIKGMYQQDKQNKIIIPASGFYEWDENKKRYYYTLDDQIIYMAGIYQPTSLFKDFSIITKQATDTLAIHDRVPIILNKQQAIDYLNNKLDIKDLPKENPHFHLSSDYENISLF